MNTNDQINRLCRVVGTRAQWTVELNCDCPKCGESVNLLDAPDFWDGRKLEIPERAKGVDVQCPECDHQFEVDTEY